MDPRVAAALKVKDEKYCAGRTGGEKYVNLRDEFAKAAMQAYSSDPLWREYSDLEETARSAYRMADAMLAARNA